MQKHAEILRPKFEAVLQILQEELNQEGITIILVTHEKEVADYARRTIHIHDGLLVSGAYGGE